MILRQTARFAEIWWENFSRKTAILAQRRRMPDNVRGASTHYRQAIIKPQQWQTRSIRKTGPPRWLRCGSFLYHTRSVATAIWSNTPESSASSTGFRAVRSDNDVCKARMGIDRSLIQKTELKALRCASIECYGILKAQKEAVRAYLNGARGLSQQRSPRWRTASEMTTARRDAPRLRRQARHRQARPPVSRRAFPAWTAKSRCGLRCRRHAHENRLTEASWQSSRMRSVA